MTEDQLSLCRRAARIAARRYQVEYDDALSEAVIAGLEHPQWWAGHTESWIRQQLVVRVMVALVRTPRAIQRAEQAYFEGAVPPTVTAQRERVRRTGRVCEDKTHRWNYDLRRCGTCLTNYKRKWRQTQAEARA